MNTKFCTYLPHYIIHRYYPFFSVIAVEPGTVFTQFGPSASSTGQDFAPKDEATKALYDKSMAYLIGNWLSQDVAQTADECAEYIVKAAADEKPQPHYLTNDKFEERVKVKFCDVTGETSLQASLKYIQ